MTQGFGVSVKYYKSQQNIGGNSALNAKFGGVDDASAFMTDWAHGQGSHPFDYGKIDPEVIVEQGNFVQQWTVKFREPTRQQFAIVKARFAPGGQFGELIEFDVELSAVPAELDLQGKDVTVNWRMYDGFNANGTFFTDSNGLEMQERHLHHRDSHLANHIQNISANYYPVQGGIAIRDNAN